MAEVAAAVVVLQHFGRRAKPLAEFPIKRTVGFRIANIDVRYPGIQGPAGQHGDDAGQRGCQRLETVKEEEELAAMELHIRCAGVHPYGIRVYPVQRLELVAEPDFGAIESQVDQGFVEPSRRRARAVALELFEHEIDDARRFEVDAIRIEAGPRAIGLDVLKKRRDAEVEWIAEPGDDPNPLAFVHSAAHVPGHPQLVIQRIRVWSDRARQRQHRRDAFQTAIGEVMEPLDRPVKRRAQMRLDRHRRDLAGLVDQVHRTA